MNRIEKIHLESLENSYWSAQFKPKNLSKEAAKVTKQIAIEFCAYCFENQEELANLDSYEARFKKFLKTKQP